MMTSRGSATPLPVVVAAELLVSEFPLPLVVCALIRQESRGISVFALCGENKKEQLKLASSDSVTQC